ncbi:protein of unknown function [Hymenobacter daecheongensis DSM 21074]|uniref:DUF4468 domain-containing protein n=1 Tax=Hymenobacter daecheongensis DSM 21074 TaxID=1121955 RepID=A0A1M6L608_9BACT|nr:DUF4468 domain-containing protein [Hymenobacter daecheongensis]SHJ66636.1 protein of unknown function [Hymenobacter daecheongensis DSM 21074]
MKKVLLGFVFAALLLTAPTAQAQDAARIEYSEQVPADELGRDALYRRALDWAENHFGYGPKTDLKFVPDAGVVRVTGTGKVKPVSPSGKEQPQVVRFDFAFKATDTGYSYSIDSFRLVPDPNKPTEQIPLADYLTQLSTEKAAARTFNERRVTAQANSLASEIAMSFRSYMNSIPAGAEGTVGLPANDQD